MNYIIITGGVGVIGAAVVRLIFNAPEKVPSFSIIEKFFILYLG